MRSSKSTGIRAATKIAGALFMIVMAAGLSFAQDDDGDDSETTGGQSLESAANDATASMWTFQLSLEGRTWKDEIGPNGQPRPERSEERR